MRRIASLAIVIASLGLPAYIMFQSDLDKKGIRKVLVERSLEKMIN